MFLNKDPQHIPLDGGELLYVSSFLNNATAKKYFDYFFEGIEWQSDTIRIFGKTYLIPRLQAWYGDEDARYSYSNIDLKPLPWSPELLALKKKVESFSDGTYNSVLLNLYRDGRDSNGWHSDDEKELGERAEIASLTLGQERAFHLKHKVKKLKKKMVLENGSLLIMRGATQANWKHQIPKSSKPIKPRINLTFRRIFT